MSAQHWLSRAAVASVLAWLAAPSDAAAVTLDVFADGVEVGTYYTSDLGCSSTGGNVSTCSGSNLVMATDAGGVRLDSWSLTFDSDPAVSGPVVVTNLAGVSQHFSFVFTLPVSPVLPSSLTGGSVQGGMTDTNGDGVTLSTAPGNAFYTARIDGADYQALYSDPQSFNSPGPFSSGNVPNLAFGTPIPSQPGPAVNSDIGIRIDFVLTAQDQASFTSVFVVQPVPEPATAALLGLGLLALGIRSRRR